MFNYHPDTKLLIQHFLTDDAHSTSTQPSGSQKVPFDWKPSFNARNTRMGDVCEVGTRIQSVMDQDFDPPLSIHLTLCADSDIIHVNTLGTSMIILSKLVQSRHRPSRPKIQYLLQQVGRLKYSFTRRIYGNPSLLRLDHTLPCSTNCKFFILHFEDNIEPV